MVDKYNLIFEAFFNIISIFKGNIYNFIFINAGLTFALLILPTKDKYVLVLKIITATFIASALILGDYREYRIFLELTPLALYGFDKVFINKTDKTALT